jgi:phage/plasmid-like protein (TIGR03299 family)
MSANVETMAYGRGIPWHGLGVKMAQELSTAEEMISGAGLDWTVAKQPMIVRLDGREIVVPNAWANTRMTDGSVLGVVGDPYQNIQNREAFAWADSLVDSGAAKYETAGSLFGGRRVFLSMELPDGISVPGDEGEVKPYLLITNGFDGGTVLQASVTMIRTVCSNTWTLALANATRTFRIRHSGSLDGKLAAAREALGVTFTYTEAFSQIAGRLALAKVTDRQVDAILRAAFPVPETQKAPEKIDRSDFAKVRAIYRETENLAPVRGTAWGVLQASGEYLDHVVDYHGRRFADVDVRMDSIVYEGPAARKKQKVLDVIQAKIPAARLAR